MVLYYIISYHIISYYIESPRIRGGLPAFTPSRTDGGGPERAIPRTRRYRDTSEIHIPIERERVAGTYRDLSGRRRGRKSYRKIFEGRGRYRHIGWHYLSNATCLMRTHLFSTA